MNQIEKAISNLSSPNKNKRYDACEELRVANSLPESAIIALEAATQDPDPLVADAARRALAIPEPPPPTEEHPFKPTDLQLQKTPIDIRLSLLWVLGSIIIYFVGIATIGRLISIEGTGFPHTIADLFLILWPITVVLSLLIGFFQWVFFRQYLKSPRWLFPAIIAGFLGFIFITYLMSAKVDFEDHASGGVAGMYDLIFLVCPSLIMGIIAGGVFLILLSRRGRKSAE